MVHFRSVCGACNNLGGRHFHFVIDDLDLLAILPEFRGRYRSYDNGRKINIWWDHSASIFEAYKIKVQALLSSLSTLIGRRETQGYEDTHLILLGDNDVFLLGPSRSIIPLKDDEIGDARVSDIADRMNIKHFNYVDLHISATT